MPKYLYTISIEFEAMDDIAARDTVKFNEDLHFEGIKGKRKLQEVYQDKTPRKIQL